MPVSRADAKMDMNAKLLSGVGAARLSAAFTLLELVVVISVITILMALSFPAFRRVQDQAKNAEAKNDLIQIVNAVNAYYTEYGKYPLSDEAADATVDGRNANTNDTLFNKLRGQGLDLTANPKDIAFISLPAAKDPSHPRSGIGTVAPTTGQFFDPWGTPYVIRLDTTFDELVEPNPYKANAGDPHGVSGGAIAWSFGKDTKSESVPTPANDKKTGTNWDDVISWQ
jgi:prepilin-type N-terminal cleavage/methylation domain-containing protein